MMHVDDAALQTVLTRIGRLAGDSIDVRTGLGEITAAMPDVFSVEGAGMLLVDDDQVLRYVASSDATARSLELMQASVGHGPCVSAFVDDLVVECDDLEDSRWPDLAEELVPLGIRAVLGWPIHVAGTPVGSLNVYRHQPYEWDRSDRDGVQAFGRLAEHVIVAGFARERNDAVVSQLQHALEARVTTERAIGIIMAIEDLTPALAFERIRSVARASRQPIGEVAARVLEKRRL